MRRTESRRVGRMRSGRTKRKLEALKSPPGGGTGDLASCLLWCTVRRRQRAQELCQASQLISPSSARDAGERGADVAAAKRNCASSKCKLTAQSQQFDKHWASEDDEPRRRIADLSPSGVACPAPSRSLLTCLHADQYNSHYHGHPVQLPPRRVARPLAGCLLYTSPSPRDS